MSDRPILFSGPMVRALLDGRKTQTRRIIAPRKKWGVNLFDGSWSDSYVLDSGNQSWREDAYPYRVGDRLYVREAWRCNGWATDLATIFYRASERDGYSAMCEQFSVAGKEPARVTGTWRPGIHMPRWASRLTLPVTNIRVQRLQDISEEDAIAEGVPDILEGNIGDEIYCRHCDGNGVHGAFGANYGVTEVDCAECATATQRYRNLWDSLNAKRPGCSWADDPWIVAVSFDVVKTNIDQAVPGAA